MIKETIIICQFEDVRVFESFEMLNNKYSRQGLVTNTRYVRVPTICFKPDFPSNHPIVTCNAIKCRKTMELVGPEDGYNYVFIPEDAEVRIIKKGEGERNELH